MKIAYILEVNPYVNSGIIKKVNDQTETWRKKNHVTKIFVVWPKPNSKATFYVTGPNQHFSHLDTLKDSFIKNYGNKILSVKKLKTKLREFQPDILYTRQNIWYPGLGSILEEHTTVLEINSVDFMEMGFNAKLKKWIYLLGKPRILKRVKGIIAVTPNILDHYKDYKIKKTVVSNGIDLGKFTNSRLKEGKVNFVFVGSKNMKWHGVGMILKLAKELPQYNFKIVGYDGGGFSWKHLKNVFFYDWMNKEDLHALYRKCHIGIGSFGNSLVGKDIDSTLKVREYLANGLPVIAGHYDVDFREAGFFLKATNARNELIDSHEIIDFVEKYKYYVVEKKELQVIATENKETQRLEFMEEVRVGSK